MGACFYKSAQKTGFGGGKKGFAGTIRPGIRVLRGPDWRLGDQDGGLGYLGTVVNIYPDNSVRVRWDIGTEATCRAGVDGAFDLRLYDNAQIGTKCSNEKCDGSYQGEAINHDILGFRWKCLVCKNIDFCTICYMSDASAGNSCRVHHRFVRYVNDRSTIVEVPPRKDSKKVPLFGIFPGAKVVKLVSSGTQQEETHGFVKEMIDFQPDAYRGAVKVVWTGAKGSDPNFQIYRVGADGLVELKMINAVSPGTVYIDHLPVLDLTKPMDAVINEEDRVRVDLSVNAFKTLMSKYCEWKPEMEEVLGKEGVVEKIKYRGNVLLRVRYNSPPVSARWTIYSNLLTKVSKVSAGDTVNVIQDPEKFRKLQMGHGGLGEGYMSILGASGRIVHIIDSSDAIVNVSGRTYRLNQSCLVLKERKSARDAESLASNSKGWGRNTLKGNSSARKKVDRRDTVFDGRLMHLEATEMFTIRETCNSKEMQIGSGAYSTVFKVKEDRLKRLGMDVAVKKVSANQKSVRKEMIASRILHPFIVPMLATFRGSQECFYLVYPFFEKKDLHGVLQECRSIKETLKCFNEARRLRVCYQVASALTYLHTAVQDVRSAVLHKDICSQNILLDAFWNARLTDFGSAREQDDTSSTASVRDTYSHPDIGKGKPASKYWDYFAFGVVVREILTGLESRGADNCYLKNMTQNRVKKYVMREVWPEDPGVSDDLCKISTSCLAVKADDISSHDTLINFEFAEVDTKLKDIFEKTECDVMERDETGSARLESEPQTPKCDVCMFNKAAITTHQRTCHESCRQPMQICMPCEKNSFLNPLSCFTCGGSLKREIGDGWGALLVAGPDNDEKFAEAFKKDVKNVKRVIVSKAPVIMGIREDNILEVFPGEEDIVPRVLNALKEFKNKNISTLMIYFSCHGKRDNGQDTVDNRQKENISSQENDQGTTHKNLGEENGNLKENLKENGEDEHNGHLLEENDGPVNTECHGKEQGHQRKDDTDHKEGENRLQENAEKGHSFLLGPEILTVETFQNELVKLDKIKNFVIILDMCFAPRVTVRERNVLQINSCAEAQRSSAISDGSTFTKFFIQGLKGASERFDCFQGGYCKLCCKFLKTEDDFLSVESLFKYIKEHMEEKRYREGEKENIQKPQMYVGSDAVNVAYNTNQPVFIDFEVKIKEQRKIVPIGLQYFTDLVPLRKRLFEECGRDESKETITIKAKKYRGDEPEVECDSLEKVMAAWINRNELFVSFD